MKQFLKVFLLVLICLPILFMQSCRSLREIALFQSSDSVLVKQIPKVIPDVPKVQPNDILAITVSSMDQTSNEVLNFANVNRLYTSLFPGTSAGGGQAGQPLGYLVDSFGRVELPFIGKIQVSGYTLSETADIVRGLIDSSLVAEPAVNVRFLNHKFSVMGEVGRPGTYNLLENRTSLPEALAMAGDIGVFGNREYVLLVRQNDQTQEMVRLDLTTDFIFTSPYYYLKNGDVIYVEPLKEKATTTDRRVQLAPIVLSAVSTTIVLLTFIINAFK
jgi:polysaccharide export outer membrane protein